MISVTLTHLSFAKNLPCTFSCSFHELVFSNPQIMQIMFLAFILVLKPNLSTFIIALGQVLIPTCLTFDGLKMKCYLNLMG